MKVLVDTSILSLALRRKSSPQNPETNILQALIKDSNVQIIGPIRQEILSGIRNHSQYLLLRDRLRAFDDLELIRDDYEKAAEFFNICRQKGIQGSNTDFLICAVSGRTHMPIFSTDQDFRRYAKYLPITLFEMRSS